MNEQVQALLPAFVLLLAGVFAIVVSKALRVSSIVGFIVVGAVIGHGGLRLINESPTT